MAKKKEVNLYEEAQRRLVGSLIASVDSSDIDEIISLVSEEDFDDPALSLMFNAIAELTRSESEISAYSVASFLESQGNLKKVGGVSFIEELYYHADTDWVTSAPPRVYASMIKDSSVKHKIDEITEELQEPLKYDSGFGAKKIVEDMQYELNELLYSISDETTITKVNSNVDNYLSLIESRKKTYEENKDDNDGLQGIPSSIDSINKYTTGWLAGQMITVAARTGIGKTVMAINSATAAARANKSVMFFSLEMGSDELQDRIYSSISSVPMKELKQGNLTEESQEWLKESVEEFRDLKITIDTDPEISVDDIRAKAIKQAQSDEGLDMIIIDYLQLIRPTGRFSSRQEAVQDISRRIKRLAKQLGVPVMILAQLNKKNDEDEEDMPRMDNIRESYAIAQDSDIVVILHRPKTEEPDPKTYIILEKNRNGESNKIITCRSDLACSKFEEIKRASGMNDTDMSNNINEGIDELVENSINDSEKMFDEITMDEITTSSNGGNDYSEITDDFLNEFDMSDDDEMPIGDDVLDMIDHD